MWWKGPDDPNVRVLRLVPEKAELWDGPASSAVAAYEFAKARITGEKPKQIASIAMPGSVYWLTFSPDGKTCYVSVFGNNDVAAIDTATKKISAVMPAGKGPKRLLILTPPEKKD